MLCDMTWRDAGRMRGPLPLSVSGACRLADDDAAAQTAVPTIHVLLTAARLPAAAAAGPRASGQHYSIPLCLLSCLDFLSKSLGLSCPFLATHAPCSFVERPPGPAPSMHVYKCTAPFPSLV